MNPAEFELSASGVDLYSNHVLERAVYLLNTRVKSRTQFKSFKRLHVRDQYTVCAVINNRTETGMPIVSRRKRALERVNCYTNSKLHDHPKFGQRRTIFHLCWSPCFWTQNDFHCNYARRNRFFPIFGTLRNGDCLGQLPKAVFSFCRNGVGTRLPE